MPMFGGGLEAFRLYGTVGVDTKPAMSGMDQLSSHVQKSGGVIQTAMGTALGFLGGQYMQQAINAGVGMLKGAAIDYNASMEQASIGFTTLLGSAEKAQSFIADLQHFAAVTPFDFPGLQSAANQMLAMGFSSKDILPTLTAVGDAVAALGLGSEAVGRATYALGQMRSAGRVNAQDMMQLTSMGIPAWQLLADAIGKTVPETRAMSEKGLIPAQTAIDAITKGIEKGNMGGMMAAQAKTFTGAMSTVKDTVNQLLGGALRPFFSALSAGAQQLATWLQSKDATAFFDNLGKAIQGAFSIAGPLIGNFLDYAGRLLAIIGAVASQVADFLAPTFTALGTAIGPVLSSAQGLLSPLGVLVTIFGQLTTGISNVGTNLATMYQEFLTKAGELVANVVPILADLAGKVASWVLDAIPPLLDNLGQFLKSMLGWFLDHLPDIVAKLAEWGLALIGWILPRLPGLLGNLLGFVNGMVGWIITTGVPKLLAAALKLGGGLVDGFIGWIAGTKGGSKGLVGNLWDWFTKSLIPGFAGWVTQLAAAGANMAIALGKAFANGLIGLVEAGINGIIGLLNSIQIHVDLPLVGRVDWWGLRIPRVHLPRLETGVWYVPHVMPAILDPGEMVLPRTAAERFRQGAASGGGSPTVVVNIREFRGTQQDVNDLTRTIARAIRLGTA